MPITRPWWNEGADSSEDSVPEDTEPHDITAGEVVTPPEDVETQWQTDTQTDDDTQSSQTQRPTQDTSKDHEVSSNVTTKPHEVTDDPNETEPEQTEAPSPLEGLEPIEMVNYAEAQLAGKNVLLTGAGGLSGIGTEDLSVLIVRGVSSGFSGTSSTMRLDMTGNGIEVHDYVYTKDGTTFYYSEEIMAAPTEISKQDMLNKYGMMPDVTIPYTFTQSNILFSNATEEGNTYRVKVTYNPMKLSSDYKKYVSYICQSGGMQLNAITAVNIDFTLNYDGTIKSMSVVETYSVTVDGVQSLCISTVSYTFAAVNAQG